MNDPPIDWQTLERYRSIGFALIELTDSGVIMNCTAAFASIVGRDRQDTIGRSIIELTAPEFRRSARRRLGHARRRDYSHFSTEKAYLLPNGERAWCFLESVLTDEKHLLSAIRRSVNPSELSELEELRQQKNEIAQKLEDVNEKMYRLMIAFAHQKNAIDVNVISGGQNNIGETEIGGHQNQNE